MIMIVFWENLEAEKRLIDLANKELGQKPQEEYHGLYDGILRYATRYTKHRAYFEPVTIDNLEFLDAEEKWSTFWARLTAGQ